jgi:uncharacterized protein (TIGR02444 family)
LTLWDFAVATHAKPGVEAACLRLQDAHGQCIPLLLWRLWTLETARGVSSDTLGAAIACARFWDSHAISPLRAVRRGLKAPCPSVPDPSRLAFRARVADLEQAGERLLLETLEALTPASRSDGDERVSALEAVGARWGLPAPLEVWERLIALAL